MTYVAVLSQSKRAFNEWVSENNKPDEKYFKVSCVDDVCGIEVQRIEYTVGWHNMREDAGYVEAMCKLRIR